MALVARTVWLIFGAAGFVSITFGQSSPDSDAPNLSENFTFSLAPQRNATTSHIIQRLAEQYELRRTLDLDAANANVFSRAIDLFRFVPFALGNSDLQRNTDDFFTPNYLRPEYNVPTPKASLFDSR